VGGLEKGDGERFCQFGEGVWGGKSLAFTSRPNRSSSLSGTPERMGKENLGRKTKKERPSAGGSLVP